MKNKLTKKSGQIILTFLFIFCLVTVELASQELTLKEAVEMGFRENREFKLAIAEFYLTEKKERYLETNNLSLDLKSTPIRLIDNKLEYPQVQLEATYPLGEEGKIDFSLANQITLNQISNKGELNLEGSYDLFTHSRLGLGLEFLLTKNNLFEEPVLTASYQQKLFPSKQIEVLESASLIDPLLTIENSFILNVADSFFSLAKRKDETDIKKEEFKISELKLAAFKVLDKNEVEILKAENEHEEAKNDWQLALDQKLRDEHDLKNLIAYPHNQDIELIIKLDYHPMEKPLSYWQNLRLELSSQIQKAREKLQEEENRLLEIKSEHGWDLNFKTTYEQKLDTMEKEHKVLLSVNRAFLPQNPYLIEEQELAVLREEINLENTILRSLREIENLYQQLLNREERIVSLQERLEEASQSLVKEKQRLELGLSTDLNIKELKLIKEKIKIDLNHQVYEHLLLRWELLALCGFDLGGELK